MDERYVLDAHGLLTYINDEPGADDVANLLSAAKSGVLKIYVSAVNLGEVAYNIERRTSAEQVAAVLASVAQLPIEVLPVTRQRALDAAHLKARYHLGYADSFAAALAIEPDASVVTGDPDFERVSGAVRVRWVKGRNP